ncbi:MAG: hypothetical protein ACKN9S_09105 [Pirellula sp.]
MQKQPRNYNCYSRVLARSIEPSKLFKIGLNLQKHSASCRRPESLNGIDPVA